MQKSLAASAIFFCLSLTKGSAMNLEHSYEKVCSTISYGLKSMAYEYEVKCRKMHKDFAEHAKLKNQISDEDILPSPIQFIKDQKAYHLEQFVFFLDQELDEAVKFDAAKWPLKDKFKTEFEKEIDAIANKYHNIIKNTPGPRDAKQKKEGLFTPSTCRVEDLSW